MDGRRKFLILLRGFFLCAICVCVASCGTSRIVQPLNKAQWKTTVDFGGPLLKNKDDQLEIVPLSSISGAYGFSQTLTGFASWNLGSYLEDVYHFDVGYTQELLAPFSVQPGITYTGLLNFFSDIHSSESRIYPQLDVNVYWILPNSDFVYTGLSNWFDLRSKKAHGEKQDNLWLSSLNLGYNKTLGKYAAGLEMRYLAPFSSSDEILVDFVSPVDQGAVGLYFSVSRTFQ